MEQHIKQGEILVEDILPGMFIGHTMYNLRTGKVELHKEGIASYQDNEGIWCTDYGFDLINPALIDIFREEIYLLKDFTREVPDPRTIIVVVNSLDRILIGEQMYVTDDNKLLTDSDIIWDASRVLEFNYVYKP